MRDHALQQVFVRPRQQTARRLHGQGAAAGGAQRLYPADDRADIDRLRTIAPGRFRLQLQDELVHPSSDMLDCPGHVALELRIVAMPFGIR